MVVLEPTNRQSSLPYSRMFLRGEVCPRAPFGLASIILVALIALSSGCASEAPSRDEIPILKTRISELERYYAGNWEGALDSLMGRNFAATSGDFGAWGAITVDDEIWSFQKFSDRLFLYTQKNAEVDLIITYMSPDSVSDTALPVKINLRKDDERWVVTGMKRVEPLVY